MTTDDWPVHINSTRFRGGVLILRTAIQGTKFPVFGRLTQPKFGSIRDAQKSSTIKKLIESCEEPNITDYGVADIPKHNCAHMAKITMIGMIWKR